MIKRLSLLHILITVISFFLTVQTKNVTASSGSEVSESQIKAAYLIHLSEFTTWPEEKMKQLFHFTICIASDSPLKDPLKQIEGRFVKDKHLQIVYDVPIEKLNTCHIFYAEDNSTKHLFEKNTQNPIPTLIVTSDFEFFKEAGTIQFYPELGKVKMRVNLKLLKQSNLVISSKLLRLMDIFPVN
jgi:YfiR/HmsC-like